MKNHLLLTLFLLSSYGLFGQQMPTSPHVSNQIIIGFSDNSSQLERMDLINSMGIMVQNNNYADPNLIGEEVLVEVPSYPVTIGGETYISEVDLIGSISGQHANVDDADLNYIITSEPFSFASYLGNANMDSYSPISNVCEIAYPGGRLKGENVPQSTTLKVAILDTGLDPYYSTINQYVAGEANVLTDDNDPTGEIALSMGYNPHNPISIDNNGHGTAVAGIIAGLSERAGLSSVSVEIYIIKCFDESGGGSLFNMLQAIRIAESFDVHLLNLSWSFSAEAEDVNAQLIEQNLRRLSDEKNMIIVTGAGNDQFSLDDFHLAPAGFSNINNLITVAGVVGEEAGCNGTLADFSNYGSAVEVAAPAASIITPGLNGYWSENASGTSFATPIVTAAVIQSWMSNFNNINSAMIGGDTHPIVTKIINTATQTTDSWINGYDGVVNFSAACNSSLEGNVGALGGRVEGGLPDTKKGGFTFNPAVEIAPNPFVDQLSISINAPEMPFLLEIRSMQGAILLQKEVVEPSNSINITLPVDLPAGLYLLRLNHNGVSSVEMIIKG